MGSWIRDFLLKYKFWAVNAVAFVTTVLLVLLALHLERQVRMDAAQASAQAQWLSARPSDQAMPKGLQLLAFATGDIPRLADNQNAA